MHWGVDDEYRKNAGIKEQGIILGTYRLNQKNNGNFEGIFSALWYIDRAGKLKYDHIEDFADPFRNNQFIGIWKSDDGKHFKKCNWGDYRIPQSGDLDIGAGEFYPNPKYKKLGWESYIKSYESMNHSLDKIDWDAK
jgi:hypothetical protein